MPKSNHLGFLILSFLFAALLSNKTVFAQTESAPKPDEVSKIGSTWFGGYLALGFTNETISEWSADDGRRALSFGLGAELNQHLEHAGLVVGLEFLEKGTLYSRIVYLDPYIGIKLGEVGFYGGAAAQISFALYEEDGTLFSSEEWGPVGCEGKTIRRFNFGPRFFLGYAIEIGRMALNFGVHGNYHLLADEEHSNRHYYSLMFHIGLSKIWSRH